MVDQDSVVGFQSSAEWTAAATLLKPLPLLPCVTRTWPSARRVALSWRRGKAIAGTLRHAGDGWLRSITSAELVGGSPPPA